MPIETRSAPAGVAHQLTTALEDIAPAPLGARTLEKSPMDISKPLPVYILGLQEAAGGAAFNKLTHGANAERLNDALHVAEQKYGSSTGYEARYSIYPPSILERSGLTALKATCSSPISTRAR
jgi:hypothetical protein